jgi:hypothetical protein
LVPIQRSCDPRRSAISTVGIYEPIAGAAGSRQYDA